MQGLFFFFMVRLQVFWLGWVFCWEWRFDICCSRKLYLPCSSLFSYALLQCILDMAVKPTSSILPCVGPDWWLLSDFVPLFRAFPVHTVVGICAKYLDSHSSTTTSVCKHSFCSKQLFSCCMSYTFSPCCSFSISDISENNAMVLVLCRNQKIGNELVVHWQNTM